MKQRALSSIVSTIIFSIILVTNLVLMRIIFVTIFKSDIKEAVFIDYFNFLKIALCYDLRYISIASVFIFPLMFFKRLRLYVFIFFIILTTCLNFGNMVFYSIFKSTFDSNLLGLFDDGFFDVIASASTGDYNISPYFMGAFICIFFWTFIYNKLININYNFSNFSTIKTIIFSILVFYVYLIAYTLQFDSLRDLSIDKSLIYPNNVFLRNTAPGAVRDLCRVIKGYLRTNKFNFNSFSPEEPREAMRNYLLETKDYDKLALFEGGENNIYKLITQTSNNTLESNKIDRIFYIVSESLSMWHFDDLYNEINLTEGLKSLIDNKHGFSIDTFIQSAPATAKSLESQMAGLINLDIYYKDSLGTFGLFKTGLAPQLNKAGFITKYVYGGSCEWQKIARFASKQGFSSIYCNSHMSDFFNDIVSNNTIDNTSEIPRYLPPHQNTWGYQDDIVFDYLIELAKSDQKLIEDQAAEATHPHIAYMLMTISNHPPYTVNIQKDIVKRMDNFIDKNIDKPRISGYRLAHIYWYDKVVTRFIKEASEIFPNALFIITGDHYDRGYIKQHLDLRVGGSIPLIIYSKALSPKKIRNVGSHLDIIPTIMELLLPKGEEFISFGRPLLSNNHSVKYSDTHNALGYFLIANDKYYYGSGGIMYNPSHNIKYITEDEKVKDLQKAREIYNNHNRAQALSWYLWKRGEEIK